VLICQLDTHGPFGGAGSCGLKYRGWFLQFLLPLFFELACSIEGGACLLAASLRFVSVGGQ